MGGKTTTSTQQVSIPKQVLQRYNAVNKMAANVAKQPFQQYGSEASDFVAQMNGQQQQGIDAINNAGNVGAPLFDQAMQYTAQGANANITPGELDVDKYMNPYQRNVVDATAALIDQGNEQAMAGQTGNAIRSGAFGGDRAGIAAATLAGQQSMSRNMTLSDILQKGYTQAQGVAQQQQGLDVATQQANAARALQAGQQFGGLGQAMQALALQGGEAQLNAGGLQQQTEQAGKTALYNQFQQEMGYPFQRAQFLANIAMGTGSLSGSTTQTTQQSPWWGSDRRLKHDITEIGKTDHGMPIYRFKYKGDDQYHMGFMAHEVEKKHPDAVAVRDDGYKAVDYSKADKFADGGQVPGPYGSTVGSQPGGNGYVPPAYLTIGDLMTADGSLLENDQQGLADSMAASARFGENMVSLKDTFGKMTYRGGVVNRAAGGGVFAPVPTESYLAPTVEQQDEETKKRNELMTAGQPPAQQSGLSQVGSAAGGIGSLLGGIASIIPFLSDRRAKENIKRIGYSHHGQPIYQYNYKGENRPQIGFIAQDVEKHHPDAVHEIGGLKHVDMSMAHKFAAGGTAGGSTATGGLNGGSRDQSAPTPAPSRPSEGSYPSQGGGLGGYIDVSKVVDSGPGWNMLEMENGKIYKNEGSWNVRANNPGNISAGTFSKYSNAVGNDGRFAVYANPDDGKAAMNSLLFETPIDAPGVSLPVDYKNLTLSQAISEYAPPKENNTPRYISLVDKAVDAPSSMVLGQYDPAQRQAMVNAMMEHEGFNNPIKQTYVGQRGRIGIPARTGFALGGVPEEEDPMMEALRRPYTDNGLTNSSGLRPGGVEAVPVSSTAATTAMPGMDGTGFGKPVPLSTAMRMQAPAKDLTPINPDAYRGTPQAERDRADAMTGPALGAPTTAGLAAPVANAVRPSVNFENNQGLAGFRRSDLDGETFVKNKPAVVEEPVPGLAPAKVVADPPAVKEYVEPIKPTLSSYSNALATVESGGNYQAVGPVVKKGTYAGDRAYGKHQVMGRNIPEWTEQALGRRMSPQEFLADPEAQEAVFNYKFGQSLEKYGNPQDAASVWFTGQPLDKGGNRNDGYITGNEYIDRFNAALNGGKDLVSRSKDTVASGLRRVTDGVENTVGTATDGIKGLLSKATSNPDLLLSILSGVGAMASSPSRYLGASILQGLGAGANTYAGLRKQGAEIRESDANAQRTAINAARDSIYEDSQGRKVVFMADGTVIPWVTFSTMKNPPLTAGLALSRQIAERTNRAAAERGDPTYRPISDQVLDTERTTPIETEQKPIYGPTETGDPSGVRWTDVSSSAVDADRNLALTQSADERKLQDVTFAKANDEAAIARTKVRDLAETNTTVADAIASNNLGTAGTFYARNVVAPIRSTLSALGIDVSGIDDADTQNVLMTKLSQARATGAMSESQYNAYQSLIDEKQLDPNSDMPPKAAAIITARLNVANQMNIDRARYLNEHRKRIGGDSFAYTNGLAAFDENMRPYYAAEMDGMQRLLSMAKTDARAQTFLKMANEGEGLTPDSAQKYLRMMLGDSVSPVMYRYFVKGY